MKPIHEHQLPRAHRAFFKELTKLASRYNFQIQGSRIIFYDADGNNPIVYSIGFVHWSDAALYRYITHPDRNVREVFVRGQNRAAKRLRRRRAR